MSGNTGTIKIALQVNDNGSVSILRNIGSESKTAGQKGKTAFDDMNTASGKFSESAGTASTALLKIGAGVATVVGVATAIKSLSDATQEYVTLAGEQETAETDLQSVLTSTGNAAGFTLTQLEEMASGLQSVTTVGDETTLSGMAILATFKNIKDEAFKGATQAALDMSQVMKQDLKSSMTMVGKALNDPIEGLSALSRVGVTFTADQKDMIKALQNSGDTMGAQKIILDELKSEFGGAAEAASQTFTGSLTQAGNALGDVKEQIGFVITKNQAFKEVIHLITGQFETFGEKIQNNREYLMNLAKDGLIMVINGIEGAVGALQFFQNGWLGLQLVGDAVVEGLATGLQALYPTIRALLSPVDLLFQGLQKIGAIDVNPFDAMAAGIDTFKQSSHDVTQNVLQDIEKTNNKYDSVKQTIEGWKDKIKEVPVTQVQADKEVYESNKSTTENMTKDSDKFFKSVSESSKDSKQDMKDWGDAGKDTADTMSSDMTSSLEDGFFTDFPNDLTDNITNDMDTWKTDGTGKASDMSTGMTGALEDGFFTDFPNDLTDNITNDMDTWKTDGTGKASDMSTGMTGALEDGFFTDFPNDLSNSITNPDGSTEDMDTWKTDGTTTSSEMGNDMEKALQDNFFSVLSGDFTSAGTAFDSFATTVGNSLLRIISTAAANKLIMYFKSAWDGDPSGKGTIETLLGIDVPFLTFAQGGEVPGIWNRKQGFAGDTVHAMLTPGEYVVPREAAQNPEVRGLLEMISGGSSGRVAAGRNIPSQMGIQGLAYGGVVEPDLPHYGFFHSIGHFFKKVVHGVGDVVGGIVSTVSDVVGDVYHWVSDSTIGKIVTGIIEAVAAWYYPALIPTMLKGAVIGAGASAIQGGNGNDILSSALFGAGAAGAAEGASAYVHGGEDLVNVNGKWKVVDASSLTTEEGSQSAIITGAHELEIGSIADSGGLQTAWGIAKQMTEDEFSQLINLPSTAFDSLEDLAGKSWETVKDMDIQGLTEDTWDKFTSLPSDTWNTIKSLGAKGMNFLRDFNLADYVAANASDMLSHFQLLLPGMGGGKGLSYSDMGGKLGMAATYNSGQSDFGFAAGGVIDRLYVPAGIPAGEDGWAPVKFHEGVVSKRGMQTLDRINAGDTGIWNARDIIVEIRKLRSELRTANIANISANRTTARYTEETYRRSQAA